MDDKQIYRRRLAIMLAVAAALLAAVVFALSRDTRSVRQGSFVSGIPGRVESADGKYYAEQSLEKAADSRENAVKVTVYDAGTKAVAGEFLTRRAYDFMGICWAPEGYDIWVQSGDAGVYRMRFEDGAWVEDHDGALPEGIELN